MRPKIVAFVNSGYRSIAMNWLAGIDRLGLLDDVEIVALDAAVHSAMQARGVRSILLPPPSEDLAALWRHRVIVLRDMMVRERRPIIHSDVDAVWLRDPSARLAGLGTDLVFSQGTIWPPESLAARGFVLCCGLFLLAANDRTLAFLTRLEEMVGDLHDDQWAVNRLVDRHDLDWVGTDSKTMDYAGSAVTISDQPFVGTSPTLTVSVVPHREMPRLMTGDSDDAVLVAHPLSGKTAAETEDVLRSHGLWFEADAATAAGEQA